MARKKSKLILPFFMILLVGLSVFFIFKTVQYKKSNAQLQESLEDSERKESALKQRYSEEKARGSALQRAKLAADSELRTLESDIEALKKEIEEARGSQDELLKRMSSNFNQCDASLKKLDKAYSELKGKYDEVGAQFITANEVIKKKEAELAERQDKMQALESQLSNANRKVKRAISHNKKMAELAEELLAEFDSRNVFGSLVNKEPFTQQGRVRLERIIQEYLDRLEPEILEDANNL